MISRQRWDDLSDDEKWNYLFRHCIATEQNLEKLGASVQRLDERLKRLGRRGQGKRVIAAAQA